MRMYTNLVIGFSALALAVACGKKSSNPAPAPQTQQGQQQQQQTEAKIPPSQMTIVAANGSFYLQLGEGSTITYKGVQYTINTSLSYIVGNTFRTVYEASNGNRLIIEGLVSQAQIQAGNTISVQVSGVMVGNTSTVSCVASCTSNTANGAFNTRNGFSPQRTAAYDQCREFFPVQLDNLSVENRRRRNECQKNVAENTFEDEVDWRDEVFQPDGP